MAPRSPYHMLLSPLPVRRVPATRTALLLLDAQCATTARNAGFAVEAGLRGITREFDEYYLQAEAALGNMARLLKAWRAQGAPVFHAVLARDAENGSRQICATNLALPSAGQAIADLRAEVTPFPGEPVLVRSTYSAFLNQDLQALLRAADVERVVIAGMLANLTVMLAAREAADRDFTVVVVQDATAGETFEWHGLAMLGLTGGAIRVQWTHEVIEMLEGTRA